MKKIFKKGFTLIELLIVIGILGILVAAVLLTINPAETQRKARDQQRLKDLSNLTAIVDQAVSDGKFEALNLTANGVYSSKVGAKKCSANWIGGTDTTAGTLDLCEYANTVPTDPVNKIDQQVAVCYPTGTTDVKKKINLFYYVTYVYDKKTYEVNVRQESLSNCSRVEEDGGNDPAAVESGTQYGTVALDVITTTIPTN